MYKIYADKTLIYDSTIDDFKIGKGDISLELNKSGSFTFTVFPDHFYFDKFIKMKTIIVVTKNDKIVFRGRILNDVINYWNNKEIVCEGELGFLQDSIIRPFEFNGTPETLFINFVESHNAQVDDFKQFKIGDITVVDANNYINRSNSNYESTFDNMNSRLIEDSLGGYFFITHGEDGTDEEPTLNYYAELTNEATQSIEFGANLKDYTKTVKADDIATAIIPLGAVVDDGNSETDDSRLTIAEVNNGLDYIYDEQAVATYGWIFKTVTWDDVTIASNLLTKAEKYLVDAIAQTMTVELTAIDLHLLDANIASFKLGDIVRVKSQPHDIDASMLCSAQSMDLLRPDNDSITLGATVKAYTQSQTGEIRKLGESFKSEVRKQANKSNGLYETLVDASNGGTIVYLHEKKSLADSQILIKVSTDGVQVSDDAGSTWYGLDVNGTLIAKLLQANGIEIVGEDTTTPLMRVDARGWGLGKNANDIKYEDSKGYIEINKEVRITAGHFTGYYSDTRKGIDIMSNAIDLYAWHEDGNFVGTLASSKLDIGGSALTLACDKDDKLVLGYVDNNGSDTRHFTSLMTFDASKPNEVPEINGTISGTFTALYGMAWNGVNITRTDAITVTVKQGLITGWTTKSTNY